MSLTTVGLLKYHEQPYPLLRQTPGAKGIWGDVRFLLEPGEEACDYVVVLNGVRERTRVLCPPENIWGVVQEPPTGRVDFYHDGNRSFARIYTTDPERRSKRHRHFHGALDWHVGGSYDALRALTCPEKGRLVSCVMSDLSYLPGHRARLAFVRALRRELAFDWFGKGIAPIAHKWDALLPYRYSIAIENYSNSLYWTEKLADCFLAWTMPIYSGCSRIEAYFPSEAMLVIDLADPDTPRIIRDAIEGRRWERNREAIRHARELVLDKYNLFAFLAEEIAKDTGPGRRARKTTIPALKRPHPLLARARRALRAWR